MKRLGCKFNSIKYRCNNPNNKNYPNYGGRGIKCLWDTYEDFICDMYPSYLEHVKEFGEKDTSIDRIDNDGNYCKENCRRATQKIQQNNRTNTRRLGILYKGIEKTFQEWIDELGLNYTTIYSRVYLRGMDFATAVEKKVRYKKPSKRRFEIS